MKRSEIVEKLIKEGFSEKTLVKFSDKQLVELSSRILGESTQVVMTKLDKNKPQDVALMNAMLKDPVKNADALKKTTFGEEIKEDGLKGGQKKLDKNHNGKIDSQDFKIMKGQKKEMGEDKKWIQKAIDPKKKGQLHKDLGVPQDEKIPAEKLKAAAKKKGKVGQRARMALNLSKLDENLEMKEWVHKLAEQNYHSFTSKNEIMELIQRKLNESQVEYGPKVKKGHNGIPEFMTYEQAPSTAPSKPGTDAPVREKPTTKPGKPKRENPFEPKHTPKPKAKLPEFLKYNKIGIKLKDSE